MNFEHAVPLRLRRPDTVVWAAPSSMPYFGVLIAARQKQGVSSVPVSHELKLEVRLVRIAMPQDISESEVLGGLTVSLKTHVTAGQKKRRD